MNDKYERAKKHVKDVKDFYSHLSVYMVMAVFFVGLNWMTSPGEWWFYWPLLGWGFGIVIHGINVLFVDQSFSSDWEEKQIRAYMGEEEYEAYRKKIKDSDQGVDLSKRD